MADEFDLSLNRLQFVIKVLQEHWLLGSSPCATDLKVGLGVLRTFLRQSQYAWSDSDKKAQHIEDLLAELRAAFVDARSNLAAAEEEGDSKVNEVYCELLEKVHYFDPKIGEAYEYMTRHCFQAPFCENQIKFWVKSLLAVSCDLNIVISESKYPVAALQGEIKVLAETLEGLHLFLSRYHTCLCNNIDTCSDFLVYLGTVAILAAEMFYKCWSDKTDSGTLKILIPDLVQKMKPLTLETIDVYLGVLKALYQVGQDVEQMLASFFSCWLPVDDQLNNCVRVGLIFLTALLIEFPQDVEVISVDIKVVIAKATYLCSSSKAGQSEKGPDLFQLLEMIEILKPEALELVLLNRSKEEGEIRLGVSLIKNLDYEQVLEGLDVLQNVLTDPPSGITEKGKLLFMHIFAASKQAINIHHMLLREPMDESMTSTIIEQLLNIKLLKAQVFWLEKTNRNTSFNHDIDTLLQGLECLQNIATALGEPIFARIDELASLAMSIYHSSCNSKDAENLLSGLLEKIDHVKDESVDAKPGLVYSFPNINRLGFFDFFLDNLGKLINSGKLNWLRYPLEMLDENLKSLKSFLQETEEQSKVHPELEILHSSITRAAYVADFTIDTIWLNSSMLFAFLLILSDTIREIKHTKAQVAEITQLSKYATETKPVTKIFSIKTLDDSVIINLHDQEEKIIHRLTSESDQRDIVSIVGMGGSGKTTLARELFKTTTQFYPRAWCSVHRGYLKRDLLLQILSYIPKQKEQTDQALDEDATHPPKQNDQYDNHSDNELVQEVYRRLMKRKYLIIIDDLPDIQAWHDLEKSFPNGCGGRILITSRNSDICSKAGGSSEPLTLRELSENESWKLLESKVFHGEDYSEEFRKFGKRIADGCKGLPLAVSALAGVLEKKKEIDQWKKIAEDINSGLDEDREQRCMSILALSYEDLPDHLKPCFLYLGAFWGNTEIPVQKLVWLWIAEGFVRKPSGMDALVEEVAELQLRELISRNLIISIKERSQGGVKLCRVHDMLQTLCLRKADEENFLHLVKGYENLLTTDANIDAGNSVLRYRQLRLSIHSKRNHFSTIKPWGLSARSLLFFATNDPYPTRPYDLSFIYINFSMLRVLDLETINMGNLFPSGIEWLKQLRYLAVSGDIERVPSILAEIWNLQTFLVKTFFVKECKIVEVPKAIWSMQSLRHLSVHDADFYPGEGKSESSFKLGNLVSLSSPRLKCGDVAEDMMKRLPRLRKLSCKLLKAHDHSSECKRSPVLSHLTELESLKISYYGIIPFPCEFHFVATIKKLTIKNCHLPSDYVSILGSLEELTVLKLHAVTFDDQNWDMFESLDSTSVELFKSLEYLKLDSLDISEWTADNDTFPSIRRLVLQNCHQLKELPYGFMESSTLDAVELQQCSKSAETSAKEIQKKVLEYNKKFKLFIDLQEVVSPKSS